MAPACCKRCGSRAGLAIGRSPIGWSLFCTSAIVPLGFLLTGASILWPATVPPSVGIHAWTAGAIALMTLAVMTRASLGHTGHKLEASVGTHTIYACALVAAIARIVAAFSPDIVLLHTAAFAWVAAFGGFALIYGPLLVRAGMRYQAQREPKSRKPACLTSG